MILTIVLLILYFLSDCPLIETFSMVRLCPCNTLYLVIYAVSALQVVQPILTS